MAKTVKTLINDLELQLEKGKISENEPVFFFRAQDCFALQRLKEWRREMLEQLTELVYQPDLPKGPDLVGMRNKIQLANESIKAFESWGKKKIPGTESLAPFDNQPQTRPENSDPY